MASLNLENVSVAYSSDTDGIHIYTHGEDSSIAIDHKPIDGEVWNAVIQKVLSGEAPGEAGEITVSFGEHKFLVRVIPFKEVCPDLDSGTVTRIYADGRCEVVEDE